MPTDKLIQIYKEAYKRERRLCQAVYYVNGWPMPDATHVRMRNAQRLRMRAGAILTQRKIRGSQIWA